MLRARRNPRTSAPRWAKFGNGGITMRSFEPGSNWLTGWIRVLSNAAGCTLC